MPGRKPRHIGEKGSKDHRKEFRKHGKKAKGKKRPKAHKTTYGL
jgi:hypothetical protein